MDFSVNYFFKKELKKFLNEDHNVREIVADKDAILSYLVLNFYSYENIADIFLGCSALNLLNIFVKQTKKITYQFRMHLSRIIYTINDLKDNDIVVYYDKIKNILVISFYNFQFSFHSEKETDIIKKLSSKVALKWDGIRKQTFSVSIFNFALNCLSLSNKTIANEPFSAFLKDEEENINEGAYKFINKQLIRLKSVNHVDDSYTKEQINYFRTRLAENSNKYTILVGKFKKVWDKHVTFITIKPYIRGVNTRTLCNHINLLRDDVEKLVGLNNLIVDHVYLIIGICKCYNSNHLRFGVRLANDLSIPPIIPRSHVSDIDSNIFSKCVTFSIERFSSNHQKNIKL